MCYLYRRKRILQVSTRCCCCCCCCCTFVARFVRYLTLGSARGARHEPSVVFGENEKKGVSAVVRYKRFSSKLPLARQRRKRATTSKTCHNMEEERKKTCGNARNLQTRVSNAKTCKTWCHRPVHPAVLSPRGVADLQPSLFCVRCFDHTCHHHTGCILI